MTFEIKPGIYWTGKIDWELRNFHGEQLTTNHGSSYNSYLIKDEKNILIDTVWTPYTGEFLNNLRELIDPKDIDMVVVNHGEPDHSGALPHLMSMIPDVPVYCTAQGEKSLRGQYHKDWNFKTVKTGDKISAGSRELMFIEAPMLHWPDTMICFLAGDNILFSNDIFGQHYASEFMYDDLADKCDLDYEALKYYANIISPFSKKALKKIDELIAMNLPIEMICPAHGVIWLDNPQQIIDSYRSWADSYQEDQITIIYETMYQSTRKMAEAIAEGIKDSSPETRIKLYNAAISDNSDLITDVFRSKGILVGSPTINNGILNNVAAILEEIEGLAPSGKKAASFGSYGWSPKSVKVINEKLENAGFEVVGKGLKAQWNPDEEAIGLCKALGAEFAGSFK